MLEPILIAEFGLNFDIILVFTKFDSKTAPVPFPPTKVIFGFLGYPIPGFNNITLSKLPDKFASNDTSVP